MTARFIEDLKERLHDLTTKLAKEEEERKQAELELQGTETTLRKDLASLESSDLTEEMENPIEESQSYLDIINKLKLIKIVKGSLSL